ncbi:MAG TPA: HD domain-containing protein [Steroidobacteraceae bacterium]|jgi:gamma-butyrobetaine dioxygenase
MTLTAQLWAIYSSRGARAYFGEIVTTLEHSLQAACFAQESNAANSLVVAALLHDIGHLIDSAPPDFAQWQTDARHEVSGGNWLAQRFGPAVSEPVRLHVAAKRYLCATDPSFLSQLSPASVQTLALQGGPMSASEIAAFCLEPFHHDAIELRRFDDRGKIAGLRTPEFAHYCRLIEEIALAAQSSSLAP